MGFVIHTMLRYSAKQENEKLLHTNMVGMKKNIGIQLTTISSMSIPSLKRERFLVYGYTI